jgi:flagellin-like protein
MNFKQLFTDDEDAVSPVIGVILMVAITVILAAVIGTFVLGLGDQVSSTSPSASFSFDYDTSEDGTTATVDLTDDATTANNGILDITHDGGDAIDGSNLDAVSAEAASNSPANFQDDLSATDVSAGTTVDVGVDNDDTVRVVWSSSNGDDTATLGKWDGPES